MKSIDQEIAELNKRVKELEKQVPPPAPAPTPKKKVCIQTIRKLWVSPFINGSQNYGSRIPVYSTKQALTEAEALQKKNGFRNYPPPFLGRRYLGRQAKVSRMVWKGFAPLSLAVSTVVLTSASAFAAHMAR